VEKGQIGRIGVKTGWSFTKKFFVFPVKNQKVKKSLQSASQLSENAFWRRI